MKIHHIGYAVESMCDAIKKFEVLGYTIGKRIKDKGRNVEIVFIKNQNNLIELISPGGGKSPIDNLLNKNGATPYHICYEVNDIYETCDKLKIDGWMIIQKPATAPAIENKLVAFLYNKTIGLIELIQIND